ncbi:MAG TPA: hypothetical protein VF705_11780, partial [Longimicrobium sp.]
TGVEPNGSNEPGRVNERKAVNKPMRTAVANVRKALPTGGRADWKGLKDNLTELLRVAGPPR